MVSYWNHVLYYCNRSSYQYFVTFVIFLSLLHGYVGSTCIWVYFLFEPCLCLTMTWIKGSDCLLSTLSLENQSINQAIKASLHIAWHTMKLMVYLMFKIQTDLQVWSFLLLPSVYETLTWINYFECFLKIKHFSLYKLIWKLDLISILPFICRLGLQ